MPVEYVQSLIHALKNSERLSQVVFGQNSGEKLPFPVEHTCAFIEAFEETGQFMVGGGCCVEEKLRISVLTPGALGDHYAREAAKLICEEMLRVDSERRILSFFVDKTALDPVSGGRMTMIEFGLNSLCERGGED